MFEFVLWSIIIIETVIFGIYIYRDQKRRKIHRLRMQKQYKRQYDRMYSGVNVLMRILSENTKAQDANPEKRADVCILVKPIVQRSKQPMMGYKPYRPAYQMLQTHPTSYTKMYARYGRPYYNDSVRLARYMQYQSDMTNLMMIHFMMNH